MSADTTTESGLAQHADGTLADMPRDLANEISGRLGTVLALLDVAVDNAPMSGEADADDGYHDSASRQAALLRLAHREVRDVMRSMSPYF